MRVTYHRSFADHTFGRIALAILTLILVIQPVKATAQTVSGVEISQDLTVADDNPLSTQGGEQALVPVLPTAQKVLLQACKNRGYGEGCAKALLGMMWKESRNLSTAVGDRGLALGYFQIHYRMHKVSAACATDLGCSAEWTIKYMERNGYPKYVAHAVQCHNGCGINNGYAASALRHGDRLWSDPMIVEVAMAK